MLIVGVLLLAGVVLLAADYLRSVSETDGIIQRNAYGQGSRTEELEIALGGEKEKFPVEIPVAEQQYSAEEVKELFRKVTDRMEKLILGENKSLNRVEYNMNLLTEIPDEPVSVSWELDRYDVMNVRGELQKDALKEEGTLVTLSAVLTYDSDEEKQALYQCTANICPKALGEEERNRNLAEEEIKKQEEDSRTKKSFRLPGHLLGKEAAYYRKMDGRGLVLIIMAVLVGILLYALEIQNKGKEREERKRQMLLDYPEIVNKMTLFLGAGMTAKRAWKKVTEDYEYQKKIRGERYAYEEMKRACYEMESGITEAESYENFGKRCDVQVYARFGALLSQNLRKGTKGLTQILRLESIQAFEERKARAKRTGEEAGTKLLLPMFLMLAVVLVIVIVPAFLSVQI